MSNPNWHDREKWGTANPYEIQQYKVETALKWTYDWGWTTPFLVDLLVQSGKRGFARKLEQDGLLHSVELYSFTPGMPHKVLRITRKGAAAIGQEYRQKKINQNTLWHDYVVQIYTAVVLLKNGFPQRNIPYMPFPKGYNKNYDVVINNYTGIEVELTKKKPIRASINTFKILLDLVNGKINTITFVSFSKETLKPYIDILKNRKITEYKLDKYRKPYKIKEHTISEQLTKKFNFATLPKPLSVQEILRLAKSP